MESDKLGRGEVRRPNGSGAGALQEAAAQGLTDNARLPPFLTAKEAARWLRVSVWAVYDAVNAKTLPAVRVGRSIRIPRDALVVKGGAPGAIEG